MKNWFISLNPSLKTAVFSSLVLTILMVVTCFLFFTGYSEIPLGILLGASVGIISYFVLGLLESKERNTKQSFTILIFIIRFILVLGVLLLTTYLYYVKNIHIFNVFAVLGGYIVPVICLMIITLRKEGK